MNKVVSILTFIALVLLGFTATAFAAGEVLSPEDGSLLDLARPVFDAIMHGNWWLGAALAVVMLCAMSRRYLPDAWGGRFIRGDVGGVLLAFAMAFGGAMATVLTAGAAMSGAVAMTALKVALAAAGGYTAIHKLASSLVATAWFQGKAPAWLKSVVGMALSMLGSNAIAKAEAAGKAAVEAKPAPGAVGIVGAPTDV